MSERIAVASGTEITIDVLVWQEGWDFDHPTVVLRPVLRYSPNGDDAEQMIEDMCEEAAVNGYLESDYDEGNGLVDRCFPLALLKRRFADALRGVEFPVKGYEATRVRMRFTPDPSDPGELMWTEVTGALVARPTQEGAPA